MRVAAADAAKMRKKRAVKYIRRRCKKAMEENCVLRERQELEVRVVLTVTPMNMCRRASR